MSWKWFPVGIWTFSWCYKTLPPPHLFWVINVFLVVVTEHKLHKGQAADEVSHETNCLDVVALFMLSHSSGQQNQALTGCWKWRRVVRGVPPLVINCRSGPAMSRQGHSHWTITRRGRCLSWQERYCQKWCPVCVSCHLFMASCADDFITFSPLSSRSKMSKVLRFCFLYCRLDHSCVIDFFSLLFVSSFIRHIAEPSLFDRFLRLQVSVFMSAE